MDIQFNLFDDDFWGNYRKTFNLSTYINPILSEIKITVPELKFNIPEPKIVNFKANLFSEKLLDEFTKSSNFNKDDVLKVSNLMRQSFIKSINIPTFTVTIDSSHPVNGVNTNKYDSVFSKSLNHIFISPSAKFLKMVSFNSATGITTPVLLRTILDQYVNYFYFSGVITILLTIYLITNYFDEDNSND